MANTSFNPENTEMETKIIEAARALFIEKGFVETSMSDIAARVGINRPVLHYYFRTKERMFRAVFGSIMEQLAPKIKDLITNKNLPIGKRVEGIVDAYYAVFKKNPSLPLFVIRELQRDSNFVINTVLASPMRVTFIKLRASLSNEMETGNLRKVPLNIVFYTFYGMLTIPFLTKNLAERILEKDDDNSFEKVLEQWKPYIVMQMEHLLSVKE